CDRPDGRDRVPHARRIAGAAAYAGTTGGARGRRHRPARAGALVRRRGRGVSRSLRHAGGRRAGRGVPELGGSRHAADVLARDRRPARAAPVATAARGAGVRPAALSRSRALVRIDPGAAGGANLVSPRLVLLALGLAVMSPACARRAAAPAPSNDLLIVGYD